MILSPLPSPVIVQALGEPYSVLAIDPGISGAVARVGRGEITARRDFKELSDISAAIRELGTGCASVIIELVSAMPGQGVVSMFSFGKSTGTAFGSVYTGWPALAIEEVHPIRWQNFYRKLFGPPKGIPFDSRALATRLLPEHEGLFKRKKDHNTADAILIGLWKLAQYHYP